MSDELTLINFREVINQEDFEIIAYNHQVIVQYNKDESLTIIHAEGGITYQINKGDYRELYGNFIFVRCDSSDILYYFGKKVLSGSKLHIASYIMNIAIVVCDNCTYLVKDAEYRMICEKPFNEVILLSEDDLIFVEPAVNGLKVILKDFDLNVVREKIIQCEYDDHLVMISCKSTYVLIYPKGHTDSLLLIDKNFRKNGHIKINAEYPDFTIYNLDIFPNVKKFLTIENDKFAIYECYPNDTSRCSGILVVNKSDKTKYQFIPKISFTVIHGKFYSSFISRDQNNNIYICDLMENVIKEAMLSMSSIGRQPGKRNLLRYI